MQNDAKSRMDTAVPKPEAAQQLSEQEKRALELQDEAEHSHGEQREKTTLDAEKAGR